MISTEDAAEVLGISPSGVLKYIKRGKLKGVKKGVWDIDPRSLRALAAKERKPGNPHKKRKPKVQRMERKPGRPVKR